MGSDSHYFFSSANHLCDQRSYVGAHPPRVHKKMGSEKIIIHRPDTFFSPSRKFHLTPLIFAVIFSRVCGSVTLAVHSSHSNVRQGSKITRSGVHNLVISPCKSSSIAYCRQQLLKETSHSLTGLSIAFWSWEKCQTLTFPCLAITL